MTYIKRSSYVTDVIDLVSIFLMYIQFMSSHHLVVNRIWQILEFQKFWHTSYAYPVLFPERTYQGWVTYRFLYAVCHNDAHTWWVITNDVLKFRKDIEFDGSCIALHVMPCCSSYVQENCLNYSPFSSLYLQKKYNGKDKECIYMSNGVLLLYFQ